MSAGAVPYPIVPPQAAFERHVTTPGDEYGQLSTEQTANFNDRSALEKQQAETTERERKQQAEVDRIDSEHKRNAGDALNAIEDEKARRDVELHKNIGEWQNRLEGAYQKAQAAPSPALFADAKTGELAKRGFGLLMAGIGDALTAYGAAKTGRGVATHAFADVVDYDLNRQREKIAKLKDNEVIARTGVKDAQEARKVAMAELDAKGAGFMKRLEAIASTRLAALKESDQGFIPAQKALAAAKEERLKYQQASLAPLTIKHTDPGVTTINRETDAKPPVPGVEDVNKTADLDSAIDNVRSMIADLKSRPKTWEEVRNNQEEWMRAQASKGVPLAEQARAGLQAVGAADVSPEQGLKASSPEARAFHQKQERFTNELGKSFFGVLTEGERGSAGSMQGNLALPPKEKIASLENFLKTVEAKRQAYTVNRGVKPAGALVPEAPVAGKNDVPPTPPPVTPETPRTAAVRLLKANPNRPGAAAIRKMYNITDGDLR